MQNIVITGLGFMGGMHAQVYSKLARAKVVAVVDTNTKGAAATARQLRLDVPIYADFDEALGAHAVDVVDICVPTPMHGVFVRRAIKAGKQVFCEKPLAGDVREAHALAVLAERSGTRMQVGQCVRFWPEYQAFAEFVQRKRAGRLLSFTLQRRSGRPTYSFGDWLNKRELSGGAALDLHVHDTDFIQYLLGRPKAVTSVGTKDATGWSHIFTTYRYDGIAVTAEGGWNYPAHWGFQMAFQAVFEHGAVEYDSGADPTIVATVKGGAKKPLPCRQPQAGKSKSGTGNISALGGYFNELDYFIDCLERGRAPEKATPRQATESVRTVLAEIKSAGTGRTVTL